MGARTRGMDQWGAGVLLAAKAVQVFGWMAIIEIGLRVLPLDRLCRLLGVPLDTAPQHRDPGIIPRKKPAGLSPADRWDPPHILRAVAAVMRRWPWGDTCLRRALVTGRMLRRHRPHLVIGVARTDQLVVAHAWIESDLGTYGFDGRSQRLLSPPETLAAL